MSVMAWQPWPESKHRTRGHVAILADGHAEEWPRVPISSNMDAAAEQDMQPIIFN